MKLRLTILLAIAIAAVAAPTVQAAPSLNIDKCLDDGAYRGRNGIVRTYPGYPCAPFRNRARVIQRVRQLLLYNGFRQAGMVVYAPPKNWRTGKFGTGSDRQIVMTAIQDGYKNGITIVKTGSRQILVQAVAYVDEGYGSLTPHGSQLRVNLSFVA